VTPSFLRKLYNAENAVAAANTTNIQSCVSFLNQYYSPSDLSKFFQKYANSAKVRTPKAVIGPNHAGNPGIECSLDTQYIMGVGRDVPTIFYSTAGQQPGNPGNEPFLVWLSNVANMTDADVPKTFSVSYGDNEPSVEFGYAQRVNAEFQKAGLRGISIMFSSGDGGVAGGQSSPCQQGKFIPTFPAGSPWVTAVGGTTGRSLGALKTASFSSGGFSDRWARPSWQDAAIKGYFASSPSGLPGKSHYNQTGAGIPDVAAQGENFQVFDGGFAQPVAGTSCSSPTFTGIVSLLNEARLVAGKSTLGYLNQVIYKQWGPQGLFNDVTKGDNPGCGTRGFPATKGWDPVTGFGSPDYAKLVKAALALP